jgi:hypothetical protein
MYCNNSASTTSGSVKALKTERSISEKDAARDY